MHAWGCFLTWFWVCFWSEFRFVDFFFFKNSLVIYRGVLSLWIVSYYWLINKISPVLLRGCRLLLSLVKSLCSHFLPFVCLISVIDTPLDSCGGCNKDPTQNKSLRPLKLSFLSHLLLPQIGFLFLAVWVLKLKFYSSSKTNWIWVIKPKQTRFGFESNINIIKKNVTH